MIICIMSCFEDLLDRAGGASSRILNLSYEIQKKGNIVHIIIPGKKNETEIKDKIFIHRFKGLFPTSILYLLGTLLSVVKPSSFLFYDPFFIIQTYKILKKSDIIQIEQPWAGGLLIPFIRLIKKPIILDAHDVFQSVRLSEGNNIRRILETFFEKICYQRVNLVLVVSKFEKELLIRVGVVSSKIIVIPNGVDIKAFSRSYGLKQIEIEKSLGLTNYFKVIFVGNMEYIPNLEAVNLITSKIAPNITKKMERVKFLLVGKYPNTLNVNDINVIFTGVVDNVADYLNLSNVAIAPLLNGSGTRLKLLEYFACSLPVVSTNRGAEGLNVENEVNIIIEDDIDNYAEKIEMLLKDSKQYELLGSNARNFVEENYSWRSICDKLHEVYIELQ